jgi:hypothetical protein
MKTTLNSKQRCLIFIDTFRLDLVRNDASGLKFRKQPAGIGDLCFEGPVMTAVSITNTKVNATETIVYATDTIVFATNTIVFMTNTNVFAANTIVFATNTNVFAAKAIVITTNTIVFVTDTIVIVTNTIVFVTKTIVKVGSQTIDKSEDGVIPDFYNCICRFYNCKNH